MGAVAHANTRSLIMPAAPSSRAHKGSVEDAMKTSFLRRWIRGNSNVPPPLLLNERMLLQ